MQNLKLTFRINDSPILVIDLNMETKASKIEYVTQNEILMHPILLPNERNYNGIESRLKWWFNDNRDLPAILNDIKKYGFLFGGQPNLRLDIEEHD